MNTSMVSSTNLPRSKPCVPYNDNIPSMAEDKLAFWQDAVNDAMQWAECSDDLADLLPTPMDEADRIALFHVMNIWLNK